MLGEDVAEAGSVAAGRAASGQGATGGDRRVLDMTTRTPAQPPKAG
jgi:hypothetical protein